MRRCETTVQYPDGFPLCFRRRYGIMPSGKMLTGIFDCAANKGSHRTRTGGAMVLCLKKPRFTRRISCCIKMSL